MYTGKRHQHAHVRMTVSSREEEGKDRGGAKKLKCLKTYIYIFICANINKNIVVK